MEEIKLPARYGLCHKLKKVGNTLWEIELDPKSTGTYRLIGLDGEHKIGTYVHALDPEGGPFMAVGSEIEDYVIKSITAQGLFELIKKQ